MSNQLIFQNTALTEIKHNNQTYITSSDLAQALQYARPDSVNKIYERNQDEFTGGMVDHVKMTLSGNLETTVRIFSLRGAHLIAMFARTPVAKEFRKWVLDILDNEISQKSQEIAPVAEPTYSRELTERQWLRFASLWFALYNNLELLGRVYKPLEALGSRYGVEAYTHWSEYQTTLGTLQRLLVPMLAEFEADPMHDAHYHKALKTLREYKPHGLGAIVRI